MTRTKFAKILRIGVFVLVALLVLSYAAFRSLPYVKGPIVEVFQPINGSSIASTTIEIVGRASRVNAITLNGANISLDEAGNFKETLVIFKGINTITIEAWDQFKRSEKTQITVLGTI